MTDLIKMKITLTIVFFLSINAILDTSWIFLYFILQYSKIYYRFVLNMLLKGETIVYSIFQLK